MEQPGGLLTSIDSPSKVYDPNEVAQRGAESLCVCASLAIGVGICWSVWILYAEPSPWPRVLWTGLAGLIGIVTVAGKERIQTAIAKRRWLHFWTPIASGALLIWISLEALVWWHGTVGPIDHQNYLGRLGAYQEEVRRRGYVIVYRNLRTGAERTDAPQESGPWGGDVFIAAIAIGGVSYLWYGLRIARRRPRS